MNDDDLSWMEAAATEWHSVLSQKQKDVIRTTSPGLARALDRSSTPPRYGPPHPRWQPTQAPSNRPSL